mmetsp:Transcript_122936/g.353127  ORF Transcript_122936/g.353127 Transcript_122936/m.353127 type:complete len:347 (-) Transcript_122936:173-1213(-)
MVCELPEVHLRVVDLGLAQELAVNVLGLLRDAVILHHPVEEVCVLLEVILHGVAPGDDGASAGDDVRPQHTAGQHAEYAGQVFLGAHGYDVAVPDGRDRHDGPVQCGGVDVPRHAWVVRCVFAAQVERGHPRGLLRRYSLGHIDALPVETQFLAQGKADQAPEACHPVGAQQSPDAELDELLSREAHRHVVLPPLQRSGTPEHTDELHQPKQPHHPQELDALEGVVAPIDCHEDEVELHHADQIDRKPCGQIHPADDPWILHDRPAGLAPVLDMNLEEKLHDHVLQENDVDESVHHEEPVARGQWPDENDLVWGDDAQEDQAEDDEHVPILHVVAVGVDEVALWVQ